MPILPPSHRRGFSLIEVLIASLIAVMFVFLLSSFQGNLNSLQNFTSEKLQSRQDIDQTVQIMTTAIRSAGPSSVGGYPIESAGTSSFVFFSDLYRNGTLERVRYFLGTSTLQEGVTIPSGNPLTYVTSTEVVTTQINDLILSSSTPFFEYYDSNYTGTQSPMSYPLVIANIRIVQFSFSAEVNQSSSASPEYFSQMVDIRNLRSNQ
jgi:prepilin-type N-terminal cleavage/methylation domain-containing protein